MPVPALHPWTCLPVLRLQALTSKRGDRWTDPCLRAAAGGGAALNPGTTAVPANSRHRLTTWLGHLYLALAWWMGGRVAGAGGAHFSPAGAAMVGPECQPEAGWAAGPSSPEQPPCIQQCRSGTAEDTCGTCDTPCDRRLFPALRPPSSPKGPEDNGAGSGLGPPDRGLSWSRSRCAPLASFRSPPGPSLTDSGATGTAAVPHQPALKVAGH